MRNVLVLHNALACHIGTVADHLDAFRLYSSNDVYICDAFSFSKRDVDLERFDVVVLHYALVISSDRDIQADLAAKLRAYRGYKVLFIQDEYRWVDRTVAAMADLGIDVVYTVINEEAVDQVYHHPQIAHVRRKVTLTGFVPEELTGRTVPDYQARPIDVGYRARRVPAWLGRFAQEKWLIGQRFKEDGKSYGLKCDIEHRENQRLNGEKWITFVSNCKAMLGTESGASFIDFSGTVQPQVEAFEHKYPHASFEEISGRFLDGDGQTVIHVISPRCFEAAALRTLMILYPGSYSGALEPWRHYVPLARDHSNMDEVVATLKDPDKASAIIDNAYREVALNKRWSFRAMVEEFDRDIEEHAGPPRRDGPSGAKGAAGAAPAVYGPQLREIERKVDRYFRYRRRNVLMAKRAAYDAVHWLIKNAVPSKYQELVIGRIRSIVRRASLS